MATEAQIRFFDNLLGDREFPPGTDKTQLRSQFAHIPDASASKWIDKAMALPRAGEVPPPF